MSKGYIHQFANKWSDAEALFSRVVQLVGEDNYDIGLEASEEEAWCKVRQDQFEEGEEGLRNVIEVLDRDEEKDEQKARAWWRLGKCLWAIGSEYVLNFFEAKLELCNYEYRCSETGIICSIYHFTETFTGLRTCVHFTWNLLPGVCVSPRPYKSLQMLSESLRTRCS